MDTVVPGPTDKRSSNVDESNLVSGPVASTEDFDWKAADEALLSIGVSRDWQSRYDFGDVNSAQIAGGFVSAHDKVFDRPVSIRRITEESGSQQASGLDLIEVIRSRAAVRHQNIVGIVDYGRDPEGVFLVTDAVEGKTLAEILSAGDCDVASAIDTVSQLCDVFVKLGSHGLALGALRPEHLVLTPSGCLKWMDFGWYGIVSDVTPRAVEGGDYRAPEQRDTAAAGNVRAEVWSLAAILFHLLTGEFPAADDGSNATVLQGVEEAIRPVLAKALQSNPEDRYATVPEFQSDLQVACDDSARKAADSTSCPKGACRSCGETNQIDREFCAACGEKLRESCLGCDTENEVWAQYCGKCGSQLQELVARRLCEIEHQKQRIERARRNYAYKQAREEIGPLLLIHHGRFEEVPNWGEQMQQKLQAEAAEQEAWMARLMIEADRAFLAGQYDETRKALDQIPPSLRSERATDLLKEVSGHLEQSANLLKQIKDAVSRRQLNGLWRQTEKYLRAHPDHPVITRIHANLQCHKHEDSSLAAEFLQRAQKAFGAGEYQQTLAELGELSEAERREPPVEQLRILAKNRIERVEDLKGAIAGTDNVRDLLNLVEELLEVQPNDEAAQDLRDDLVEEVELADREISSRQKQWRGRLAVLVLTGVVLATVVGWIWSSSQMTRQVSQVRDPGTADAGSLVPQNGQPKLENESGDTRVVAGPAETQRAVGDVSSQVPVVDQADSDSLSTRNSTQVATPDRDSAEPGGVVPSTPSVDPSVVTAKTRAVNSQESPALAPFSVPQAVAYQQAWAAAYQVPVGLTNSIGLELRLIPAGEFLMGSSADVADRDRDERQHRVALTEPYYLGIHEVTQRQYEEVMGENDSKFRGPERPVEQVSWNDAVVFCRKLSALPAEKAAGHVYRLPTEAEWEYACRAGTVTPYNTGESGADLSGAAWFNGNTTATQAVGQKHPNAFGLFDMAGNVWEWCQDRYGAYTDKQVRDPQGPLTGLERVSRGGSWINLPQVCRSARRSRFSPERSYTVLGFRVLCLPVDR